ncbi:MSMEG_0570 family nitrogen starvation response protein [Solimonas sp. SE-A11]|uniref:MSMEG_0570 family nitrogen starvation response protein n=1 Tax=Solimonas sp. SE-A11 TaxID=3054954 RepID=UPI00259C972E|nr:MSMEG_0570 family nitrogen starvation response protein [Solimonas sp. SE-A11]MDM4769482.1 MSMEG_0570 family nitrogen starvation response protein [Solimonas sp. SE-A11]
MPETLFLVRWPDDSTSRCYSPSSTIREAFEPGRRYPLADFVERSRAALEHASARVTQKYGFGCGQALAQIRAIEQRATLYPDGGHVVVESFES